MKLKDEQVKRIRAVFDKVGAFEGYTEDKIREVINGVMDIYVTMAKINLRLHKEKRKKKD